MAKAIEIVEADLGREDHQREIRDLTNSYAMDPMGNGAPLAPEIIEQLIEGLRSHPTTMIFLAYGEQQAVGIATCFLGFSTFYARPLINVHDLAILPQHRGRGIGKKLLGAVEQKARELGCCKVTLEVQENNTLARRVYESSGFAQAVYGDSTGGSLFYTKKL